jgi:hypothetical protein
MGHPRVDEQSAAEVSAPLEYHSTRYGSTGALIHPSC